jgi:hypothetical protein
MPLTPTQNPGPNRDRARGDVAEREGFAVSPEDREHHDRRADVADHQEDLEERAERDAGVVAGAEDVVGVAEHRVVENERGGDGREKRRGHEPAGETSGPSLLRRLLWQGSRHARLYVRSSGFPADTMRA